MRQSLRTGQGCRFARVTRRTLRRRDPSVAAAGLRLNAKSAVLDGEVVAVDEHGHPSFQALQHRAAYPRHTIVFYAFDLLHLNGEDLTRVPLEDRRKRLPDVLNKSGLLLSMELPGTAGQVITAVQQLGLALDVHRER